MTNRTIKHPFWADETKTKIVCQFHYDSGEVLEASVMDTEDGNPDWAEIIETFGMEELDAATEKFASERKRHKEIEEAQKKEAVEVDMAGALFNAKLGAFEIEEVKSSKDRVLKSRIRKAKNIMEVMVLTSALVTKEMNNGESE